MDVMMQTTMETTISQVYERHHGDDDFLHLSYDITDGSGAAHGKTEKERVVGVVHKASLARLVVVDLWFEAFDRLGWRIQVPEKSKEEDEVDDIFDRTDEVDPWQMECSIHADALLSMYPDQLPVILLLDDAASSGGPPPQFFEREDNRNVNL